MSNIERKYCIVCIERETRVFHDVVEIASTIEEATEAAEHHNSLLLENRFTHIIVPVIME